MSRRLVVLASGNGSNAQALIDASAAGTLGATVAAVVTNDEHAGVIARAEAADVTVEVVSHTGRTAAERAAADERLATAIEKHQADLVVLAGWMRILGDDFCDRFAIINLHPAMPGEYPGVGAIDRAWADAQRGEITATGVMVHWVPDSGVDVGPAIVCERVSVGPHDSHDVFTTRMHETEHRLIVRGAQLALDELERRRRSR